MAGISYDKVREYWKKRSAEQGACAVGPNNWDLTRQEKVYSERREFLADKLPLEACVLDYGCGTGRYSRLFAPEKYLGMDVCENLLVVAKRDNPDYDYELLYEPVPAMTDFPFEVFFTATVLQHNDDDSVGRILATLRTVTAERRLTLWVYENISRLPGKVHICFRSVERYLELIASHFDTGRYRVWSHVVHGEEHSLIQVEAEPRGRQC